MPKHVSISTYLDAKNGKKYLKTIPMEIFPQSQIFSAKYVKLTYVITRNLRNVLLSWPVVVLDEIKN